VPRRQQSGEIDRMGGISKCGDALMRETLFEAALVLMVFFTLLLGVIDCGQVLFAHESLVAILLLVLLSHAAGG
jgi:hypothetical protein